MTDLQRAIITKTEQWIRSFIIKLNLCPFAEREMNRNSVKLQVSFATTEADALTDLLSEFQFLDTFANTDTTLLIFPHILADFFTYLDFLDCAERTLQHANYTGIYQLASFHPDYCFAETDPQDVTNYTNRSPYPMVHLLRESSVEKAIAYYGDTTTIPQKNIARLQAIGLNKVQDIHALLE